MHFFMNLPLYFCYGLLAIWHYALFIPHPSWHRLVEAFVTGLVIKAGYLVAHKLAQFYKLETRRKRKPKAGAGQGFAAGAAEFLER